MKQVFEFSDLQKREMAVPHLLIFISLLPQQFQVTIIIKVVFMLTMPVGTFSVNLMAFQASGPDCALENIGN
jgi:hypothetical protein